MFFCLLPDATYTTNGENSSVNRDSNEKTAPSENPGAPNKQPIGNAQGIHSKSSLFDVEGTIDFDFSENGEIDLRWIHVVQNRCKKVIQRF